MRKTDPTHKIEPTKFDWWLQRVGGSRKPPPISLPRIRALETPAEPSDPKQPEGRPYKRSFDASHRGRLQSCVRPVVKHVSPSLARLS
jgi:hypothetical protein